MNTNTLHSHLHTPPALKLHVLLTYHYMTTYIINSLYIFKKLHATHPQIHLKTRKMSTHVYSSYVN